MKAKKLFSLGLVILFGLLMVGCGDSGINVEDGNNENKGDTEVTYTVKFENTSLSDKIVKPGESLAQPSDPEKENKIFTGWYLDSKFNDKATFPMTINKNTAIYAKFDSYDQAFKSARRNTIGDDVNSFEFDYKIICTASYNSTSLNGLTVGNSKYNKNSEISFYDEHTNSGTLFIDGSKYQIRKDTLLQNITMNEDNEITKFTSEEVGADYKFDSSNFAKALFEWDDNKLKSIEKVSNNVYKLKTGFSYSDGIKLVGKFINSPIIEKIIGELPETNVETDMKVTFANGYISEYVYTMNISVTSLSFNLTYTLDFKNIDKLGEIVPKAFDNLSLTDSEIANVFSDIGTKLVAYKAQEKSSFDFKVKTAVGFAGKNDINSTFAGKAIRKIDGDNVYFHNEIEIDSDYKNADLYKTAGIEDVKVIKTKLSNNEVWLIEKKLIGSNDNQVANYKANDNDSYYLLPLFSIINKYSFAQKIIDAKDNEVEYIFGLTNENVVSIMNYLETILNLDPLAKAALQVKLFGIFNDVACDEAVIKAKLKGNELVEIEFEAKGEFKTKLNGSRDFTLSQNATFEIDVELKFTNDYTTYEPYDSVKKAK